MKKLQVTILSLILSMATGLQAASSSENRQSKTILVNHHASLLFDYGVGVDLGLFLNPDTVLEGHLSYGANFSGQINHLGGLGIRRFFTNSIYAMGGVATRYAYKPKYEDLEYERGDKLSDTHISDVGFELSLGNQWFMGGFTIGLDWFYAYIPVHTYSRVYREYDQFGEVEKRDRSTTGHYADPIVTLPRLNIGFAF